MVADSTRLLKRASLQRCDVTPEMVSAGASVLWELAGETSKEAQAREVFLAMAALWPNRVKSGGK